MLTVYFALLSTLIKSLTELCLTVFCLYFIILCNTTGVSHLKVYSFTVIASNTRGFIFQIRNFHFIFKVCIMCVISGFRFGVNGVLAPVEYYAE